MKIINNCLTQVEPSDLVDGTFIFPPEVNSIATYAFSSCNTSLKSIEIPDTITHIGTHAFANCSVLESVKLPSNLKNISEGMFENCKSLKNIEIPESVEFIGASAFAGCSMLESIKLPNTLTEIYFSTFKNCHSLKNITLSENLISIFPDAFENCFSLEEITLPEGFTSFSINCFKNCINLKRVNLPNSLRRIRSSCFEGCYELESIEFPSDLIEIGDSAFKNCYALKNIVIPQKVNSIGSKAFESCQSLVSVEINNNSISYGEFLNCSSLKTVRVTSKVDIDVNAFYDCKSLESIELNDSVGHVAGSAFANCKSLKSINFKEGLTSIGKGSFYGCESLESVNLPSTIQRIGPDAFLNCDSLNFLHIPDTATSMNNFKSSSLLFFNKTDNGFNLSANQTESSIPTKMINLNYCFLSQYWEYKDILLKEQRNPEIADFYNQFIASLPREKAEAFIKNHNFTFFKQLDYYENPFINKYNLYKVLYNLGAFEPPIVKENGKKVDYAQKVVEFIKEKVDLTKLFHLFSNMEIEGFKPEFTDFFLKNYGTQELTDEEKLTPGFLARCYNEFEEVQLTNTNNHGSQRQLKPTVKKFKSYFITDKFRGVTEENAPIAETVSVYFDNQRTFDRAVEIDKQRQKHRVRPHILKQPLKEEDVFAEIDDYLDKIPKKQIEILGTLTDVATNEFSFEWLAKNDPQNFVLGKLCSCCAHLEGVGYGIMNASIIHPNVQNLVIKNKKGEIVAKSTLYINKYGRYGVCNNVEVRNGLSNYEVEQIYQKFVLGIREFALRYNKEHPLLKLRQINVGMSNNDLTYPIERNRKAAKINLRALSYDKYGHGDCRYSGDSRYLQYVIWSESEEKRVQKNSAKTETPPASEKNQE